MSSEPDGRVDFAVIGAGFAGLRTALALSETGATVTVFEARSRVGGRAFSAPRTVGTTTTPSLVLDLGAQWVGPGQIETLRLAKELGLQTVPTDVPGRTIWNIDGRLKQGGAAYPPLPPHALADVFLNAARVVWMSKGIAPQTPWLGRKSQRYDQVTAEDWIRRHLRTASGREFARMYIRESLAIEPKETAVLGVLFDLRSIGPARDLATAEAFRLREGTYELARRLADRLPDRIRFEDPVRAITQDGNGVIVESDTCKLQCRRVAVCVPPPLANQISYAPALPEQRARLLANLPMSATVKFHAVYQRPFWRSRGLSGQAWSNQGAVGMTYDNSPQDGTGRGVLVGLVVADEARRLGAADSSARELDILASLGQIFGPDGAAPDELVIQDWGAEEWTRGCYAAHFPAGAWTSYGSAFRVPCARIHWAGTETATEWHGYIEGALRSGIRVAHEILQADASDRGGQ